MLFSLPLFHHLIIFKQSSFVGKIIPVSSFIILVSDDISYVTDKSVAILEYRIIQILYSQVAFHHTSIFRTVLDGGSIAQQSL